MASIFKNAADSMEEFETLSKKSTSYDQRFRVPISQARMTPFGIKNPQYIGDFDAEISPGIRSSPKSLRETNPPGPNYKPGLSHSHSPGKTKIKTGLKSHEVKYPTEKRQLSPPTVSDLDLGPSKIRYPTFAKLKWRVARSSSSSSMASDCHSSHGVPLVIPLPDKPEDKMNSIDTWLTEVRSRLSSNLIIDGSPKHKITSERKSRSNVYPNLPPQSSSIHRTEVPDYISNITKSIEPLAELSNDKENTSPKASPLRALPFYHSALMRSPSSVKLSPTRLYSALSPSPHSPLRYPPRRIPKAFAFPDNPAPELLCPPSTPFTIHEDDCGSNLSPISPNVEIYRKKRVPRTKRDQLEIDFDRLLEKLDWEKKNGVWEGFEGYEGNKEKEVMGERSVDNDHGGDGKDNDGFWTQENSDIRRGKKETLGMSERSEDRTCENHNLFVEQTQKDEGVRVGFLHAKVGQGKKGEGKEYF